MTGPRWTWNLSLHDFYLIEHSQRPHLRLEDIYKHVLDLLVQVKRDLRVSWTRLPTAVGLSRRIWLEDLSIPRLVEDGVKETRLARVSEVRRCPVKPVVNRLSVKKKL